ncbi:MAG: substrate-binding domain-containing protein [Oscillospiraceae bacterium]|nr:substrate-binding domain-containing protein [Oscillospiraceae bacterium]MDD7041337.1 substrate-binding domain-containing protein [Oscillospiraceae bacterium]MDY2611466.1 substrate-binding domain-containing protein [Oscillospiraceae bacterium]
MKKMISVCMAALMLSAFAGCSSTTTSSESSYGGGTENSSASAQSSQAEANFDTSKDIAVISREDGSGTRGAFVELFGVEEKDADGNKVDRTSDEADITNSTSVMMTSVAGNPYSIGYISLGSLNETVKAVKIDGAEATVENVKSGAYGISRPFNIATKAEVSEVAQDFIDFIMSSDGQKVVEEAGCIPQETSGAYAGSKPSGKIVVAGSSSVTPVMQKLKEAYLAVNPNAEIEIQESDSTTGMNSAIDGVCDIGMASRELKDTEIEKGLTPTVIATDGIAVIVNNENPIEDLTKDQVKSIYIGETISWSEVA